MFEYAIERLEKKISKLQFIISDNIDRESKNMPFCDTTYDTRCIESIQEDIKFLNIVRDGEYDFTEEINNWLNELDVNIIDCGLIDIYYHKQSIGILEDYHHRGLTTEQIDDIKLAIKYLKKNSVLLFSICTDLGNWIRKCPIKPKEAINGTK